METGPSAGNQVDELHALSPAEQSLEAYRLTGEIVSLLRRITKAQLAESVTPGDGLNGLPAVVAERLRKRQAYEQSIVMFAENSPDIVDYATLGDLLEILSNLADDSPILGRLSHSREVLVARFEELRTVEAKLTAFRAVSEADLSFVCSFHQRLVAAFGWIAPVDNDPSGSRSPGETAQEAPQEQSSFSKGLADSTSSKVAEEAKDSESSYETAPVPLQSEARPREPREKEDRSRPGRHCASAVGSDRLSETSPNQGSSLASRGSGPQTLPQSLPQPSHQPAGSVSCTESSDLAGQEEDETGSYAGSGPSADRFERARPGPAAASGVGHSGQPTAARVEQALSSGDDREVLAAFQHEIRFLAEQVWKNNELPRPVIWNLVSQSDWYSRSFSTIGLHPISDFYSLYDALARHSEQSLGGFDRQEFLRSHNFTKTLVALGEMFRRSYN